MSDVRVVPDPDELRYSIEKMLDCLIGRERSAMVMAALKFTAPPSNQPEENAVEEAEQVDEHFELARRLHEFPYWLRPPIFEFIREMFAAFDQEFDWEFESQSGAEERDRSSANLSYTGIRRVGLWDGYYPVGILIKPDDIVRAVEAYWVVCKRQLPQGERIDACDQRELLRRLESWRNAVEGAIARARDMRVTEGTE